VVVEVKWKAFAEPVREKEYVMLISLLPLKHYWNLPSFFRHTGAIQNQLSESNGLIGYSLRLSLVSKKGWTLSVWEDERSLAEFVRKTPHAATMEKLRRSMKQTKFVTQTILGSNVPPNWDEALGYLN
jgi:hypothetical protein